MISLEKKQLVLIEYHQHNTSQRKIAEKLKMSRNTVKKYIEQDLAARQQDTRDLPITDNYVTPPAYKKRKGKKEVLTNTVKKRLRQMMKQNEQKRELNMHKQQLKIIDMHEKLLDEGFTIGYTTVRNFVNHEEQRKKEVYIRQDPSVGREIEFDWGEVKLFIDGKLRSFSLAVFTLAYSNERYARLYESETMVCVQDAHVKCIEHLGFVPNVFTYDNMRTVVKNFIGNDRFITDGMKSISLHYHFQIRLCQPRKGNEKGHVERSVEFIRRKAFAHRDTFTSLEEAQQYLISILEKLNHRKHYLKEKTHHELMLEERAERANSLTVAPIDPAELVELRVDKYSTVTYRHNHYSVPEGHVGEYIKLKARAEGIFIFSEGECIAKHKRSWQLHTWVMDIYHYLETIDVTHAHYVFPSGMLSLLLKKMFGIPFIVTAHGGDIERMAKKSTRIRNWTASILRESEHVIAVGPVLAQQIEQDFGIEKDKISIVSMGVNREVFTKGSQAAVCKELQLASEPFRFLFVGNVIKQKGVEELLQAFQMLKTKVSRPLELNLVGSRRDQAFFQSLQPLISEDVKFIDPLKQQELVKWFQASDVFVLPSHLEGFGLVALEALATDTPVIATNVGGLVSLLGEGAGHLVEPENAMVLSEEMLRAVNTPKDQYMNREAVDKVLTIHDEKNITARCIAIYKSAIEGRDGL